MVSPLTRRAFLNRSGTQRCYCAALFGGGVGELVTPLHRPPLGPRDFGPALSTQTPAISCCNKLQRRTISQTCTRSFPTRRRSPSPASPLPPVAPHDLRHRAVPPASAGHGQPHPRPVSHAILSIARNCCSWAASRETVVPGCALLLLFWKAAAAGWISYSGGGRQPLEEFDWPYEEAEFVVRALSDPALKPLGPRDPDLSRGNIFSGPRIPARFTPAGLRVLVVSPYLPYPLSHGGRSAFTISAGRSDRVRPDPRHLPRKRRLRAFR